MKEGQWNPNCGGGAKSGRHVTYVYSGMMGTVGSGKIGIYIMGRNKGRCGVSTIWGGETWTWGTAFREMGIGEEDRR